MSAAAKNARYRGGQAVSGSLAKELDWAVRERELRHAGDPPKSKEKARVHAAPKVQVRERQYVSRFAVAGVAAVIVLAVLILMSYIQLTMLSAETVELRSQLEELKTDHEILQAQYGQMFDMATVKAAAEAAGMGKPSASQVRRIDLTEGDSAVVYQKERPSLIGRVLASLNHGVYAVVEYFD